MVFEVAIFDVTDADGFESAYRSARGQVRGTERFKAWRSAIGPFFVQPPQVEHFSDLA